MRGAELSEPSASLRLVYLKGTSMSNILRTVGVLAIVLALTHSGKAQAQVAGAAGYNPYTGYGSRGAVGYNPYTGASRGGQNSYNPYTGTRDQSRSYYNPYTGKSASVQRAYNPYTGRSAYHYNYHR